MWETLSTRSPFGNRWVTVEIDTVRLPNRDEYEYTRLVPAAEGVAVFGFDSMGRILLEREYRHGVGEIIWQLPGGLIESGEDPADTGLRELLEETGFAPNAPGPETVFKLGSVWDNPAFGPAVSHVYVARDLVEQSRPEWDLGEAVGIEWVTAGWLRSAIADGLVRDRVVLAAATWLLLRGLL